METDYLVTSLPSADLGVDRQHLYDQYCAESLLAECMPQLADVISAGYMQYDSTVPANLFSDGEDSSDEEVLPLVTSSMSDTSTATTTATSTPALVPETPLLQVDPLDSGNFDITSYALSKAALCLENIHTPTTSASQLDAISVENLLGLPDDFKMSESDFACLDLNDAVGATLFENGIAAQDMGSLLEQFEEAAANLPEWEEDMPDVTPPKKEARIILKREPEKSVPKTPKNSQSAESEVMRLLMAKTPKNTATTNTGSDSPAQKPPPTSSSSRNTKASKPASSLSKTTLLRSTPVASKPISMHQRPPSSSSRSTPSNAKSSSGSSKAVSSRTTSSTSKSSGSLKIDAVSSKSSSKSSSHSKSTPASKTTKMASKSASKSSALSSKSNPLSSKIASVLSKTIPELKKAGKSKANTPPPEVLEKIRASNKRKSTIMLPSSPPSKSQRGHPSVPSIPRQPLSKKARELSFFPQTNKYLNKQLSINTRRLSKSSASAPCSPSTKAKPIGTYSAPVSPTQAPLSTTNKSTIKTSRSETSMSTMVPEETFQPNSDYFDLIIDHDYCQNSRNASRQTSPTNSSLSSPIPRNVGTSDSLQTGEDLDGSMLKSLLLNKNLTDELKRQAAEQRACMKRKVSVNLDVVDMDIDEPEARFSKFAPERTDLAEDPSAGAISIGLPLPPLPPLDQLPKDHEIRALEGQGQDSSKAPRPVNDMNFILDRAKKMLLAGKPGVRMIPKDKSIETNDSVKSAHASDPVKRTIQAKTTPRDPRCKIEDKSSDSNESLQSAREMKDFLNKAKRLIKVNKPQPHDRNTGSSEDKNSDSNDSLKSASEMNRLLNQVTGTIQPRSQPPEHVTRSPEEKGVTGTIKPRSRPPEHITRSPEEKGVTGIIKPRSRPPEHITRSPEEKGVTGIIKPRSQPPEHITRSPEETGVTGIIKPRSRLPEHITRSPEEKGVTGIIKPRSRPPEHITHSPDEKGSDSNEPTVKQPQDQSHHNTKSKRPVRSRNPAQPQKTDNLFDKLPNYFTAQAAPSVMPEMPKVVDSARNMYTSIPVLDRDPSPERDSGFSKLPTYFCFTNSLKYDESTGAPVAPTPPALSTPTTGAPMDAQPEGVSIGEAPSGSQEPPDTPTCEAAKSELPVSRPSSRSPSPRHSPARSDSRSSSSSASGSSSCKSRSASSERSPSPAPNTTQVRGRSVRKRTFRKKRHSYSSSQSSSCSRSRSRSRSRLRSPNQTPVCWSRSRSRSKSQSRSRSRSRSTSFSRSSSQRRDFERRGERVRNRFTSKREEDRVLEQQDKKKQIEERRIVYVGCIPSNFTRRDLRRQFDRFGEIEDVSVHFREHGGDNYGFVTFVYTCDAFNAIEKGKTIHAMSRYDLCFGGRREFCKAQYADLDGDMEIEEEMAPVMGRSKGPVDFDELLRQARTKIKKPVKDNAPKLSSTRH